VLPIAFKLKVYSFGISTAIVPLSLGIKCPVLKDTLNVVLYPPALVPTVKAANKKDSHGKISLFRIVKGVSAMSLCDLICDPRIGRD